MPKPKNHKTAVAMSKHFIPQFYENVDKRTEVSRELRHRLKKLRDDTATDSMQKELLCQRAIFISLQLETMEVDAMNGEPFELGVYTQMVNTLVGILKALGLERQSKAVTLDLKEYVRQKA